MRAGITLHVTEEEVAELLKSENYNDVLRKIISEGRFEFDGDSYIPSISVELYNKENGTNYEEDDYEFNL